MIRSAELFAVTAIVLLAFGLVFPRISGLNNVSLSLYSNRDFSYAVPPQLVLFGVAAVFCLFAFVYRMPVVHMNRSAATWHFWLSGVAIVLFGIGLIAPATLATGPRSSATTAGLFALFLSLPVFLGGQIVFLINLLFGLIRGSSGQ